MKSFYLSPSGTLVSITDLNDYDNKSQYKY